MNKFKYTVLLLILFIPLILPMNVEAQTIQQFEEEVAKYTAELQAKKDKVAKNDKEVAEIKAKIVDLEKQVATTENEIETLEKEIDESNKKIAKKKEESKKIMKYFQIINGENSYLEYIFEADSMTDMIYRISVVEQLADYNQKIVKELNELINENNRKKSELENKKQQLKNLEKELQSQKERINADTASLKAAMPGIEEQIKSAKAQIANLKRMGCGQTETVTACTNRYWASRTSSNGGSSTATTDEIARIVAGAGFYRPMAYGYITQGYGGYGGHMGVDLGSSNKSITLYPIRAGTVSAKYYDNAGALVLKIRHYVNGQVLYSTYAHLRSWYVSVGQEVNPNTAIGQMGSTGNSTGPHLHLEITTCDWKSEGGGCTWKQYQKSTINPIETIGLPSRWNNR